MSIYVMGDLHLSTNQATNKSMEVFGKRWQGYTDRIRKNWTAVVRPEDTVVIPGDLSWAMNLEEALPDFAFLESLPGTKLVGKGNHDFWWTTGSKLNRFFEAHNIRSVRILYNNAYRVEDSVLCGTRGWFLDEKQQATVGEVDHQKIVNRETIRLRLSLEQAMGLVREAEATEGRRLPVAVFLHFPPVWPPVSFDFVCREILDVLHEYDIHECYFGHIHGMYSIPRSFDFEGISMTLTSSDFLNFALMPIRPGED